MAEVSVFAPLAGAAASGWDNRGAAAQAHLAEASSTARFAVEHLHVGHRPVGPCYAAHTKDGQPCRSPAVKGTDLCYGHWRSALAYAKAAGMDVRDPLERPHDDEPVVPAVGDDGEVES